MRGARRSGRGRRGAHAVDTDVFVSMGEEDVREGEAGRARPLPGRRDAHGAGPPGLLLIEMTRQNNRRLAESVKRSITMAGNLVMVGLSIQMALARQSRVLEATRRTREFLGEMLASNAAAIARHTKEIGDLYTSPVIAIDKITQAHNALLEAIETANDLRAQGIATARENASTLAKLALEMERRSGMLPSAPEAPSIEA